ncbi:MAG: oligosaccharide flippase family protein [Ardenticatenaceae bacterium]|nr:oligosaccharide flippase family protein [Ardenticatenaceae bacterium]
MLFPRPIENSLDKEETFVLKNGFYNALGGIVRMLISILVIPFLIRIIGLQEYGVWVLASAVLGFVQLVEAGLSISTTVFVSQNLRENNSIALSQTLTVVVGGMFVLATFAATVLYFGSPIIANLLPRLEPAERYAILLALQVGSLVIWFQLMQRVFVGVEQAHQRYGIINLLVGLEAILTNVGLLIVAWIGGRTVAFMKWYAVAGLIMLLLHTIFVWWLLRYQKVRPHWNYRRARDVARYSGLTWISTLSGALFTQFDRVIVGAILGPTILGVYAVITTVAKKINFVSVLPIQPLLPTLSKMYSDETPDRQPMIVLVKKALQLNVVVSLGAGISVFMFANIIMQIMISDVIPEGAVWGLRIAAIIYALYTLNAVGYFTLMSTKAAHICAAIQISGALLSLLLIAIGSRYYGLMGAVIGNVGNLVTWLMVVWGMKRVGIVNQSWIRWIIFPLVWFSTVIFVGILTVDRVIIQAVVALVGDFILLGWLINTQQINLLAYISKLSQGLKNIFLPKPTHVN